jgi:hypothetical protein
VANFPNSVPAFSFVPAAGKAIPYDALEAIQGEIVAIGTTLISGFARARAYNTTVQSLANITVTPLLFNTEDYDLGAMHSTSVNTSRMTCPANGTGAYKVIGIVYFLGNATGVARAVRLRKNGVDEGSQIVAPPPNANPMSVQIEKIIGMVPGDYVELCAYQDSGGALNVGDATTRVLQCELTVARIW